MTQYFIKKINSGNTINHISYVDYDTIVVPKTGGTFTGSVSASTFYGDGGNLQNVITNNSLSAGTLMEILTGDTTVINNTISRVTNEPTGFLNLTDNEFTFDDNSRTLNIVNSSASTAFTFYVKGKKFEKTNESVVIDDIEGTHYIYFDENGVLTASTNFDLVFIYSNALVSIIYWDKDNQKCIYFGEERHGVTMDGVTQAYLHLKEGTAYMRGLQLKNFDIDGDGDNDSAAQFSCDDGEIWDEDIRYQIVNGYPQTLSGVLKAPLFYMSGTTGIWRKQDASNFIGKTTGSGRLAYNKNTLGTWTVEEVSNADFALLHLFATTDKYYPIIGIMGQQIYTTKNLARKGANSEINNLIITGLPAPEFIAIGSIIFQTRDGYTNTIKSRIVSTDTGESYVNWLNSTITPTSAPGSHSNLLDLDADDHSQYALLEGRSGDTISIDTVVPYSGNAVTFSGTIVSKSGVTLGNITDGEVGTMRFVPHEDGECGDLQLKVHGSWANIGAYEDTLFIHDADDFQNVSGNEITLADNTVYKINGIINMGDKYFKLGNKTMLVGDTPFVSGFIYTGSSNAMFTATENILFGMTHLMISSRNAEVFNISGSSSSSSSSSSVAVNYSVFSNSKSIGAIKNIGTLALMDNNYQYNQDGLLLYNVYDLIYKKQYFSEIAKNSGTTLHISGYSYNSIAIAGNRFFTDTGYTAVKVENGVVISNNALVNDNQFIGDGTYVDGVTIANDVMWRFNGNVGIDNQTILPAYDDYDLIEFVNTIQGMMVLNTDRKGISYYDGTEWRHLTGVTFDYIPYFTEDFESGSFSTNSWTVKNDQTYTTNQWIVGTDTSVLESLNGTYAAYISTSPTGNAEYQATGSDNPKDIAHLYKTITLPTVPTISSMNVQFDWKCYAETNYDFGYVYWVPTGVTINGGTEIDSSYRIGGPYNKPSDQPWETESIEVSVSPNESGNLVFSFLSDYSIVNNPGFCIDNIKVLYK